jgi:hypothetical protein
LGIEGSEVGDQRTEVGGQESDRALSPALSRRARGTSEPRIERGRNTDHAGVPSAFHPWLPAGFRVIRVFRGPVPGSALFSTHPQDGWQGSTKVRSRFDQGAFEVRPGLQNPVIPRKNKHGEIEKENPRPWALSAFNIVARTELVHSGRKDLPVQKPPGRMASTPVLLASYSSPTAILLASCCRSTRMLLHETGRKHRKTAGKTGNPCDDRSFKKNSTAMCTKKLGVRS